MHKGSHRHRVDPRRGKADEIGRGDVVGNRADFGADAAAVEKQIETADDDHGCEKVSTENRPTLTPGPSAIVDVSIQPPATLCVSGSRLVDTTN
jgi:hypothetical protein